MKKICILSLILLTVNSLFIMSQEKITQTAGHVQLGEFAPKFAELNDDVLFGQVWNRPGLSPHDRSMITIATLIGKGIIDSSLTHHLQFAKQNGVTRTEICDVVITCTGQRPAGGELFDALCARGYDVVKAGDALGMGNIRSNVRSGFLIGYGV